MFAHLHRRIWTLACGLGLAALRLAAAGHDIDLDTVHVDGRARGIQPGDIIRLLPGERAALSFVHVRGTAEQPVVIVNAGGKVRVGSATARHAIHFSDCAHFQLRGDGVADLRHGIEVFAARSEGGVGVQVNDGSTNFELCFLEIHGAGFAGIMAKSDPRCDGSFTRGTFVQRDTHIHHNHIHDVGGEGLYIGHSFYSGWKHDCDGDPTTPPDVLLPHDLIFVRIHDNLIERTGWDGLQVGSARAACEIVDNVISHTGLKQVRYQQNGIQIGEGTTGRCRGNRVTDAGAHGIIVLGLGNHEITDNVIVRAGAYGIFCDDRPDTIDGSFVRIEHNVITEAARGALLDYNERCVVSFADNVITLRAGTEAVTTENGAQPIVRENVIHR